MRRAANVESGGEIEMLAEVEVESGGETEMLVEVESGGETEIMSVEVESGGETEMLVEVESGGETEIMPTEVESRGETEMLAEVEVESGGETEMLVEVESGGETEIMPAEVESVESGAEMAEIEITMPAEVEIGAELRWPFIRKMYSMVAIQLLLAIAVASVVLSVPPVARFFFSSIPGSFLYIFLIFVPFLRFCPLKYYSILFIFTVAVAFTTGLGCAFLRRKVILEGVILTTAVVLSLTLSTFWAARRGIDFNFLRPCLSTALVVTILFAFIQTLLGKSSVMIYGCLTSIIYGGYIIYDTDNIIKRLSYDELIWAAFSLYLDIMDLFGSLVTLFTRNK